MKQHKWLLRGIIVLFAYLLFYILTSIFYILYQDNKFYLYTQKSDSNPVFYESRRKLLIKNLSLIDRFFVVGYHGGFVDGFEYKESWMKREDYEESRSLSFLNKIIQDQGICTLGGKEVSMYAYYYTYTLFGLPYNEYVITCNQVKITSPLGHVLKKEIIKPTKFN